MIGIVSLCSVFLKSYLLTDGDRSHCSWFGFVCTHVRNKAMRESLDAQVKQLDAEIHSLNQMTANIEESSRPRLQELQRQIPEWEAEVETASKKTKDSFKDCEAAISSRKALQSQMPVQSLQSLEASQFLVNGVRRLTESINSAIGALKADVAILGLHSTVRNFHLLTSLLIKSVARGMSRLGQKPYALVKPSVQRVIKDQTLLIGKIEEKAGKTVDPHKSSQPASLV
jgi:hypothetical protein